MSVLLPGPRSVRLRETVGELIVEVDVPPGVEPARMSARLARGVLEIRLPRRPCDARIRGFHPDASGV